AATPAGKGDDDEGIQAHRGPGEVPPGPGDYRRSARPGAARLPDAPGFRPSQGARGGGEVQPASPEVHRGAGPAHEPAAQPGIEAAATPVAPLLARAVPAAPGLRTQPRRGGRRQGPPGPRPGDAGAVGPAQ